MGDKVEWRSPAGTTDHFIHGQKFKVHPSRGRPSTASASGRDIVRQGILRLVLKV